MNYSVVVWGFDKADSELEAKLKFRMSGDFAYTERYTIISVKGVKK